MVLGVWKAFAALAALPLGALAIYPLGHFDHVTEIASEELFASHVQSEIDAGRTLFVRWIASPGMRGKGPLLSNPEQRHVDRRAHPHLCLPLFLIELTLFIVVSYSG